MISMMIMMMMIIIIIIIIIIILNTNILTTLSCSRECEKHTYEEEFLVCEVMSMMWNNWKMEAAMQWRQMLIVWKKSPPDAVRSQQVLNGMES